MGASFSTRTCHETRDMDVMALFENRFGVGLRCELPPLDVTDRILTSD